MQKSATGHHFTVLANRIHNAVERDRARRAAKRNLRFQETVPERVSEVVAVIDADRTFRFISGAVEELLGYTPAEVREQGPFATVHPDDRADLEWQFAERQSNPDRPTGIEFRILSPEGTLVPVQARAYNLVADPDVEGVIVYPRTSEPTP